MSDNSFGETSYRISDAYVRIYSTTNRLLIEPTQYELQSYHNNIESQERADTSAAAINAASTPDIPS